MLDFYYFSNGGKDVMEKKIYVFCIKIFEMEVVYVQLF